MRLALHIMMWTAGAVTLLAAHLGDLRTYAEGVVFTAACAAALVLGFDYGRDDRF